MSLTQVKGFILQADESFKNVGIEDPAFEQGEQRAGKNFQKAVSAGC